jgi:hypothetical protein
LLGVAHHLHQVGWRRIVRDLHLLEVPDPGQLGDVGIVGPVPETGQITVGPALPGVLCGGLAVHLEDACAWLAEHAANEIDVVTCTAAAVA